MLNDLLSKRSQDRFFAVISSFSGMGRTLPVALLSLLCAIVVPSLHAASWYVDNAATGANNGNSWADAWRSPTNIVWASVNPGDTVFVSGGSTSKLYTNSLVIGKNGTAGNPITVRIGQDPGHNGVAIFSNATIHPNGSRPQWNVIDGGRNPAFVAPTNYQQVALDRNDKVQATTITNNIGFRIVDIYGTNNSVTSPCAWFLRKPDNCTFRWIQVSGLTNTGTYPYASTRGTVCYIDQGDETQPATNTVFEYLYLFGNMGQQFAGGTGHNSGANFDEMVFRYLWIDQGGEDHFELGGGVTVRDSVIGPCFPNGVHNDFFQFTGNRIKVYNNDIRESQNAIMRIQTSPAGAGTNIRHSVWFYNNLVTEKQGRALGGGTLTESFCMVHFDSQSPTHMTVWSNIVFANNLFYNSVLSTVVEPGEMSRNSVMYWSRGAQVTNSIIMSNLFVNNLMVMKHKGIGFPVSTKIQASGTFRPYTTNDMWVDYNVFAGTNTSLIDNPRRISYMDIVSNAESHPFRFRNVTNFPAWVDAANSDFELLPSDTAAKNTGYNLSAYFNFDALNRPRNIGGAWDRGPLEQPQPATAPPGTFNLAGPASGATDQSVTPLFTWSTSSEAAFYTVEISASSAFAPLLHSANASGSSYLVPAGVLAAGGTYYWRVRAGNDLGTLLANNAPFWLRAQATTTPPPGAFSLADPSSGATLSSLTPTLTWTSSSAAVSYQIELDTDPAFAAPLLHSITVSGTAYTIPAGVLSSGSTIFWRIRAVNTAGDVLAANAPFSLAVQAASVQAPGAFALSSPASNVGDVPVAPLFTWSDASGETDYLLEIDSDNAFGAPLIHQASLPANAVSYQMPAGTLANSSTYFWRVRARNAGGETVADFAPRAFSTAAVSEPRPDVGVTNGLVTWLRFDDDFSDSRVEDSSGNGNHGYRFGRIGSAFPTNFPTRVLASSAAGTAIRTNLTSSDYAGDFIWHNTGYGIYGREGQYVGMTNVSRLTNAAQASIMCWARYESAPYGNNYSVDANATLISAGTSAGVPGSWDFGRYNQKIWLNNTRFYVITNQATFGRTIIEFPDRGYDNKGDTTNWNHYAITWDNGVLHGYLNGRPIATNDISAIVTTLKIGRNPNNATPWIGIGCNTHSGTPWLDDEAPNIEYPNHGFMNGAIDDVRIYDRALSAGEIDSIVFGSPMAPAKPAPPSTLRIAAVP